MRIAAAQQTSRQLQCRALNSCGVYQRQRLLRARARRPFYGQNRGLFRETWWHQPTKLRCTAPSDAQQCSRRASRRRSARIQHGKYIFIHIDRLADALPQQHCAHTRKPRRVFIITATLCQPLPRRHQYTTRICVRAYIVELYHSTRYVLDVLAAGELVVAHRKGFWRGAVFVGNTRDA